MTMQRQCSCSQRTEVEKLARVSDLPNHLEAQPKHHGDNRKGINCFPLLRFNCKSSSSCSMLHSADKIAFSSRASREPAMQAHAEGKQRRTR